MRLDIYLTLQNHAMSRTRASNLIALGLVLVNGSPAKKPAMEVGEFDTVEVVKDYDASLGGIKLKGAFEIFQMDVRNRICLDIGASNGGFTDVLLQNGAKKVYALDVAECALPHHLKDDSRVVVMEKYNARYLDKSHFQDAIQFVSIDVSFISLTLILPTVYALLDAGKVLALIKPQFECGKSELTKTGLVKNKKAIDKALEKIKNSALALGYVYEGIIEAPRPFSYKNQEYFILLSR